MTPKPDSQTLYQDRSFYQRAYDAGTDCWSGLGELDEIYERYLRDHPGEGRSVLDIGCGAGRIAVRFALAGYRVTGIDYLPEAVRRARKAVREAGVTASCRIVEGSAFAMPFEQPFDVVIDGGCFHHIRKRQWPLYMRELERLTRPGGEYLIFVFSTRDRHANRGTRNWIHHRGHYDHFFTREELRQTFARRFHRFEILPFADPPLHHFLFCRMLRR